jgi:hypothetical protein
MVTIICLQLATKITVPLTLTKEHIQYERTSKCHTVIFITTVLTSQLISCSELYTPEVYPPHP